MLLSSILIVCCFMFSLLNIRTPVRTLKATKNNSKSGLYDVRDLDIFDVILYNFGLRKHWKKFLGITEEDGQLKVHSPWYLKNLTKMSYGSDGPVFKPDWKGICILLLPIILNLCLVAFVPACAIGVPFVLGATFTSKATGDFDATGATTWNEANFPVTGDTFTVQNAHVVSIKGTEASGSGTVDSGGTLRFDGQTDATPAILNLDNGATLLNNGTVDQTGTGSTGYAGVNGVSAEIISGSQFTFGAGYWKFGQCNFNYDIATGGGGCTFEFVDDCTIDAITVTANDTLTCTTNGVQIAMDASKELTCSGGTLVLSPVGGGGNEIDITSGRSLIIGTDSTVDLQYMTTNMARGGIKWTAGSGVTITNLDNCSFTCYSNSYAGVQILGAQLSTWTNCTFASAGATYTTSDVYIYSTRMAIFDTCTRTNGTIGMRSGSGWALFKDGSSNFTIYGILASSETPSAGYRAVDITGDLTLSQADVYLTSFNTSYTLGANAVNIDDITVDASTTLDTSGTNYSLTSSTTITIRGTAYFNGSTVIGTTNISLPSSTSLVRGSSGTASPSGAHTYGGIYTGNASAVLNLTSNTTTMNANTGGACFQINTTTLVHNNGTMDFTLAGAQFFYASNPGTTLTLYNVTLTKGAGNTLQYFNAKGFDLTVANNLTITSGTFDTSEAKSGNSWDLTVTNDISITDTLTGNASTITVGNDITNAGTFTAGTSTFVLTDADHTLTGSWTFWHFTCAVATARTLTFENGETYTFGGNVTLNGASGQLLSLVSDAPGTPWDFVMSSGAVKTNLDYLSVADSDASGSHASQKPIDPTNSTDAGNNTDWFASAVSGSADPFMIFIQMGMG